MALWRATTYSEILDPASPTESHAVDNGRATRVIMVDWEDRTQAALDFLGYTDVATANTGEYVSRIVPHTYPGYPKMYCTSIPRIEGVGPTGKTDEDSDGAMLAEYLYAHLTLVYTTPPYEILSDEDLVNAGDVDAFGNPSEGKALAAGRPRWVSVVRKPGYQILTFNRQLMKNPDNNALPIMEGVPLIVPHVDIEYTWHQIPAAAIPWAQWGESMGRINDDVFDNYEENTLLMYAPEVVPITGPFGARQFNVIFRMRYKPQYSFDATPVPLGWNYYLAPTGTGGAVAFKMSKLTVNGDENGDPSYRETNFTLSLETPV